MPVINECKQINTNIMTAITFLVAVLSAVAAIFAVLFFQDRKDAMK